MRTKQITTLVVALFTLALITPAFAGGWTDVIQIKEINQQPSSGVGADLVFVETTLTSNPSGCSYGSGFYFAVSDEKRKRIFAMLMSAHMTARSVRIFFTGQCHSPWGFAEMDGVIVR